MIWIKRILFILFVLVVLIASTVLFISWKYADDLKQYALDATHSTIVTDLEFDEDVVLSLWKDFPSVAVEISNIRIEDSFGTDTLLNVEKAFVQFNLIKIIQGNISIEGIRVTDGFIKLRRSENDEWNFRVWKEKDDDGEKAKTDFSIEILTLENIHLDYDDREIDLNIQYQFDKSKIKGRFTDGNQRLRFTISGFMERLNTIGSNRVVDLPLNLAGILNINSQDHIYTIEMGNAILAGNEMVLDAEWTKVDGGTSMEMKVNAGNIEPSEFLPKVWPQIPENVKSLELTGKSDLIFSLNGPFTKEHGPQLDATIRMRDGSLVFQNTNVSELNFEGNLYMKDIKRSKAMEVSFDQFSLKTPKGNVKGKGTLTDLSNPRLRLTSSGNTRLEELITVATISEHLQGSGNIAWNIDFEGPLGKDFNTTMAELKQMRWTGSLDLSESQLSFNSSFPPITEFSSQVKMEQNKTSLTNCNGKIGHLKFEGDAVLNGLKEILTAPAKPVVLTGNVSLDELDVVKLPQEWSFESSEGEGAASRPVSIKVNVKANRILYHDFTATNVAGSIAMKNQTVDVSNLRFSALEGNISADLQFAPNSAGYLMNLDAALNNINISRALDEWNNFGQSTVTSTNLKGRATANLSSDIYLDQDYNLIKDELRVDADVEISGGELIEFEPLQAMSRFISVDELKRVQFDTLRNRLSIRNSKLVIPKMSVSSNILNVQVFGEHAFDQEMDYHVNLLLNDLLRRKAKKKKTFEGHEIVGEGGKTRLFLWVRGKPGDLKVGYDKREVRKKLKDDFKKEGQTIKQLFKEEFGGAKEKQEESEEVQFRLEEDDDVPTIKIETETPEPDKPKKKKKKKRGLFSSEPDEGETEGGFEIEFEP